MLRSSWPGVGIAALLACGGGSGSATLPSESTPLGPSTGTTVQGCIDNGWTGLTYAGFGQAFMANYCTSCHSAASTSRRGAPAGTDLDTLPEVKVHAAHIDELTGMNIAGTVRNTAMPPPNLGLRAPNDTERMQVSCWIAYGLPP